MAARKQTLTPLIDLRNATFARQYELGIWWSMYGEEQGNGLVPDNYLIDNLRWMVTDKEMFNGEQESWLYETVGFLLGMVHGGVLSPQTGTLRPEVSTLVAIHHQEFARAYSVGREWFFVNAEPHERLLTDTDIVERLRESIQENRACFDSPDDRLIYWMVGDLLGGLSGHLFLSTEQDEHMWATLQQQHEQGDQYWLSTQEPTTEPLPRVIVREEAEEA